MGNTRHQRHYGLTVSAYLDGEGGDGTSIQFMCSSNWQDQQKCRFFMCHMMPPEPGEQCHYKDGIGCCNPWCKLEGIRKIKALIQEAEKELKEETGEA